MLARAALRALQTPYTPLRSVPLIPITALHIRRGYASNKPPRPPPPPLTGAKPQRRPPPPPPKENFQTPTRSARQTSPGTSFPRDETWKPQDGIKFGGPAAATPTAPVEGGKTTDAAQQSPGFSDMRMDVDDPTPVRKLESELSPDTKSERPLAQDINMDRPAPGDERDHTHRMQAEAENTPPPSEAASEQPSEATSPPRQPLPDLRQGIPSTFEFEFGQARQRAAAQDAALAADQAAAEREAAGGLDLTYETSEGQQQRDRGERDYDSSAYETSLDRRRAMLANYFYASILILSLTGGLYLSRPFSTHEEIPSTLPTEDASGWSPTQMWARVRARFGNQLGYYTEPTFGKLLPEVPENQRQPFTLVLSLEDLMIHSTWDREHGYRTAKRPGIDYFIRYLSQYYELVLFTSVPIAMADPVIKKLDPYHFIMWPLGREATKYEAGEYVKDLAYLNRDLKKTIIIDTHAPHVRNQPENAVVIPKWSGDPRGEETGDLVRLIPFLEYVATMGTDDVRTVLASFSGTDIPTEFARRESIAREKFHAQLEEERKKRPARSLGSLGSALGIKGGAGSSMMGGGMVLADGQSVAEGLREGKMLSDQIREQGQRQYEFLEKQIREHGAKWLEEEAEEQRKMMEAQMKDMKKGWFGSKKE